MDSWVLKHLGPDTIHFGIGTADVVSFFRLESVLSGTFFIEMSR